MNRSSLLATASLFILTFAACRGGDATPSTTSPTAPVPTSIPGLNDFVFEASVLPEACSVKENASISSDREFADLLVGLVLVDDELAPSVVSALYAVYYEGAEYNEIGYFGFEFDSTKSVVQAVDFLIQEDQRSAPGRFSVFFVGNIVVEVWRDDQGSEGCFSPLKELVNVQTEIGGGLELT